MPAIDEVVHVRTLPAGVWSVDRANSRVGFSLKHMVLRTVRGGFGDFDGVVEIRDGEARAHGSVSAASIDTGDGVRDEHLRRSRDFFDVERHPEISFRSGRLELDDGVVSAEGELTMRGVTRPLQLRGHLGSPGCQDGEPALKMTLQGELSRSDFGLVWNQTLDTGGALLGDTVKIDLELTAVPPADG